MRCPRLAETLRPQTLASFFRIVMTQIRHSSLGRKASQPRGHAFDPRDADNFFNQIDLPGEIRTETRHRPIRTRFVQPQPLQNRVDLRIRNLQPEQRAAAIVVQSHLRSGGRQLSSYEHLWFGSTAGGLQNQIHGPRRCRQDAGWIDSPLEAVTRVGRNTHFPRGLAHPRRLEPRAFEQKICRPVAHPRRCAAHDACEGHRFPAVGDDQIMFAQLQLRAIQGREAFAFARVAHHNAAFQFGEIERM